MNSKKMIFSVSNKYLLLFVFVITCSNLFASKVIDAIATSAGGYDIPIKIMLPDNRTEKSPVFFFVHGGGWNGGTATEVPKAEIPNDAGYLCDRLGIIYVGLAYRCKGNNGTFNLAIEDLEVSIAWFMSKANDYNADLSRIGFGGSSAGTTLSAILAQRYETCKLYVGREGMYNIIDQDPNLSHFPNQEGKEAYGLISKEQKLAASPYYNLKDEPAPVLLFHGKDDYLCHYSQSEKYAEKIIKARGTAKVVLYDKINHTCLNPGYPEVFRNTVMEIAKFYVKEFQLKFIEYNAIESELEKRLKGNYPSIDITSEQLLGSWKNNNGTLVLKENEEGYFLNKEGKKSKMFSYENTGLKVYIKEEGVKNKRTFYLRKNKDTIYELIVDESRLKSRHIDYQKQH